MTLAKTIIYGSDSEVAELLQRGGDLNEIDEYGYTPLIQTAIVNSMTKAQLLLEAEAEVDFPDLTGRTALYWAAENSNYDLCELLLKYGANPNAYTHAGQSVLVNPLLRKKIDVKRLLLNNGAKLGFAQDFINTKLLGHRFELEGRADIVDNNDVFMEVELEGFYLEFSLDAIASSLTDFRWNFVGKHLQKYFPQVEAIIESLQVARELLKYQHYLVKVTEYKKKISQLLSYEPLLIPVVFNGHAITFIKSEDFLVRCDRGKFGMENGTVNCYKVNNKLAFNKDFIEQLIYKRQHKHFINHGMVQYLDLETKHQLNLLPQKAGNCSWANVEAVVPTMLFLLLLEKRGEKHLAECQQEAFNFYHEWQGWDRNRSLGFCFDRFAYDDNEARKAARCTLLASILFQACRYDKPEDPYKAKKILSILADPKYHYILRSYLQVFSAAEYQYPDHLHNLRNYLDDFGVNLDA